jgi:hypothetical protein
VTGGIDQVQLVGVAVVRGVGIMRTAWALMVMPRSRSRSMESSTWACISRAVSDPVSSSRRSASVDLPWSICAMIAKVADESCVHEGLILDSSRGKTVLSCQFSVRSCDHYGNEVIGWTRIMA